MKTYTKRILTWLMVIAMLTGIILTDYRLPVFSRAEGQAGQEHQANNNGTSGEGENPQVTGAGTEGNIPANQPGQQAAASESQNDISDKVEVLLWDFWVTEDGKDKYIFKEGNKEGKYPYSFHHRDISIKYQWKIKENNIKYAKAGTSFSFILPEKGNISYEDKSNLPLETKEKEVFGHFSIQDGVLTATIEEDLSNKDDLHAGFFKIRVKCFEDLDQFEVITNYETQTKDIFKPQRPSNPDILAGNPGRFRPYEPKGPIEKGHYTDRERWEKEGELQYILKINHDKLITAYNEGKQISQITPINNVVVIDELPDKVEIPDEEKVYIRAVILGPATKENPNSTGNGDKYILSGKLSGAPALLLNVYPENKTAYKFGEEKEKENEDWTAFKTRIKSLKKPTVGIWQKKKLIINFGEKLPTTDVNYDEKLPTTDVNYDDTAFYGVGGFDQALTDAQKRDKKAWPYAINKAQADKIKEYYGGQPLLAFNISFFTKVDKDVPKYINKAIFSWNEKDEESNPSIFYSSKYEGGGEYSDTKIDVTIKKLWRGTSEDKIKIELWEQVQGISDKLRDTYEIEKKDNKWELTIPGLPKSVDNKNIKYIVKEKATDKYIFEETSWEQDPTSGNQTVAITNIETRDIKVRKVWQGNNASDNLPEIEVELLGENDKVEETKPLNASSSWEGTFSKLPKFNKSGEEIQYKIREKTSVLGYESKVEGDMNTGFTITNQKIEKINIIVNKRWVKSDGTTALPDDHKSIPKSIDLELINKANASEVIAKGKMTKTDKGWVFDGFRNLPLKDSKGAVIAYQVREIDVNGFDAEVADVTKEGDTYQATLTNRLIDQKTKIVVKKIWKDENGDVITTGLPEKVQVNVSRKGTTEVVKSVELNGNGSNPWKAEIELAKLDEKGDVIKYKVQETVPEGYFVSPIIETIENGNQVFTITNTKIKKVDLHVEKRWMDTDGKTPLSDEYDKIPAEIQVRLLANNGATDKTLTLKRENKWKGSFTDLPLRNPVGDLIAYSVEEVNAPNNMVWRTKKDDSSNNTVIITNTKTDETVNIKISKNWLDINNQPIDGTSGKLPGGVQFKVFANGVPAGYTIKVTKADNWEASRTLPKLDKKGKEIVYTVKEVETPGYQVSIKQKAGEEYSFVATNKELPVPPAPIIPPLPEDPITIPPNTVIPPLPETPQDTIVIEDDEVALADNEEPELEEEPETVEEAEPEEEPKEDEEITDDLPRANKNVPKTHDFFMNGFANPLAVSTVIMMGYGIKKLVAKKKKD